MSKTEFNECCKSKPSVINEKYVKTHFSVIYFEILVFTNFSDDFTFKQKLYHYLNNDPALKLGICPECGRRCNFISIIKGYHEYCSRKCADSSDKKKAKFRQSCLEKFGAEYPLQSNDIQQKMKQTNLERYGKEYYAQTDEFRYKYTYVCLEKYGSEYYLQTDEFKEKSKQTNLEKYGCENSMQSEDVKEKFTETCIGRYGKKYYIQTDEYKEKSKQTNLEKYGCENSMQSEDVKEKSKQTNLEKYGKEHYAQTKEFKNKFKNYEWLKNRQEKMYHTKKKNNTFNTSKIEEQLKLYLDGLGVRYEHQYTSDQYPFNCDFYFPDKDLYVEIQGNWTHGPRPFTGSDEDLKLLEKWKSKNTKYYQNAIETWTIRDVKKREIAKQNNLIWIEIFSNNINDVVKALKLYLKLSNTKDV